MASFYIADIKSARVWDKRQSDLLDAENRSHDFLGLCAISPFLSLSLSVSLSSSLLALAITRPLPIFARRISFAEKFYFPLFDAIEMQTPVAVSGTASVLSVRSARCTCIRDSSPRYGFTVTSRRNEGAFRQRARCRSSSLFYP